MLYYRYMSETWKKITQILEDEQKKMKEEQRIADERQRVIDLEKFEREKIKLREKELAQQKEQEENDRANAVREKIKREISKADEIAVSVLEEIRKNSQEIRQARLSEIVNDNHNISLIWGNKFEMTEKERYILYEYRLASPYYGIKQPRKLPECFIGEDYSEISTHIDGENALNIITNPNIIIKSFAIQLAHPMRHLKWYNKGTDYWIPRDTSRDWNPQH